MDSFQFDAFTFRTIIEASPYPVYLCIGEEMIVTYANAATLRTWGKTNSVIGKAFVEAIPEIKNQPYYQLLLNVFHSGNAYHSGDERADLEVDGKIQTYYFNFAYQPYRNPLGQIVGVFCFATDVTELVTNRQRLAASKESLRIAVDAAELGTFDRDLENGKHYWDQRCRQLLNIRDNSNVKYECDFLASVHPDDRQWVNKHIYEYVFNKKLSNGNFDVVFRTLEQGNGTIRWIKSKGTVFFDAKEKPVRFIGTMLDITKQREEETRKDAFISIASHELKTPLTTIKAQAQLLMREMKRIDNSVILDSLERLNRQINNMSTLVDNFLNTNSLLEGKLHFKFERFDMQELLKEVVDDHRSILSRHELKLDDCETVIVWGDRRKIGQVIENLLSNAAKYSPSNSTITVFCKPDAHRTEIGVIDQGVGISESEQKKLFDRFYRVESESVSNVSGFGLGLYLVAEILREHNTSIYVRSAPNEGSCFSFHLPLSKFSAGGDEVNLET